jgi:paired amphipathic helix protein Sin3a
MLCCVVAGPQGAQLIELLRKNPAVAIPVVIIRLEQKEAEWLKV